MYRHYTLCAKESFACLNFWVDQLEQRHCKIGRVFFKKGN